MMSKWCFLPVLLVTALLTANSQDVHLKEPGSALMLARSTFAHGYLHGYEEGYHRGNLDVNMARPAHSRRRQFHDIAMGYSPRFGSRQSFEDGFQAGFQAGYWDGYAGRQFRVVDAVRALAANMDATDASAHPADFDRGVAAGYHDGFAQGESSPKAQAALDFESVSCAPRFQSSPTGFCEGYRRGFALGRVDALTLHREDILEASK
jgi:hypothetical protein